MSDYRILHTGKAQIVVAFDIDELLEIAACTGNREVRRRVLTATALLDKARADEAPQGHRRRHGRGRRLMDERSTPCEKCGRPNCRVELWTKRVEAIKNNEPCMAYPEDGAFKTPGIEPCVDCGSSHCFIAYLRWEHTIDGCNLNAQHYHLTDGRYERMPLDEAERGLAAARVSCFIRASQRERYRR